MKTKKIINDCKAHSIDAYIKYICPNKNCNEHHWISLKESKIKNYKIVCEVCDIVFSPKTVKKLKIIYDENNTKNKTEKKHEIKKKDVPISLLNDTAKLLFDFGFTLNESIELINISYQEIETDNKYILLDHIKQKIGA